MRSHRTLAEPPLVRDGARGADHERRVLSDEILVVGAGDEADRATAVVHVNPEALQLAADKVGSVARRRLENAERDRVDADHAERAVGVCTLHDRGRIRLEGTQKARVLEIDARDVVGEQGFERSEVERAGGGVAGDLGDRHLRPARARDDRAPLGREQRRYERAAPSAEPSGHEDRAGGGGSPVVRGLRDDVALNQVAHEARELEECLQLAVIGIRLAVVRRQELRAADDLVDDRGYVVRPAAAAQERQSVTARQIAIEQTFEPSAQLDLGADSRLDVEETSQA